MKKILLLLLIISCTIPKAFTQSDTILSKKERRFIHEKSKYISFSNGFGFTSIRVKDPNNFLNQGLQMQNTTFVPNIMYEHGIANSFFAELGYSSIWQGVFYSRIINDIGFSSYSRLYRNHNIQFGGGYRIINKNNFHFFNLHGGVFIGFSNKKITNLPINYGSENVDPVSNYPFTITTKINNFSPISFGTYLGISKELRLSKDVRFFVKYIQQFGFKNTMSGTFELASDQINFVNEPVTFKISGGGAFVTGGLKILLFKKQLK